MSIDKGYEIFLNIFHTNMVSYLNEFIENNNTIYKNE